MHINYNDNGAIESIDVEPHGDRRKDIEKALQRFFQNSTAKCRAGLIAAGEADCNKAHPHYQKYKQLADNMEIKTETVDYWGKWDYDVTRVKITDNN